MIPSVPGTLPVTYADVQKALVEVRKALPVSPLTLSTLFSELAGREIYLKWDNKFRTGSFKERGAVTVLAMLTPEQRVRGLCAASAGNHALALSFHAARAGVPCTIVMPVSAPLVKVQASKNTGARIILQGATVDEAYEVAKDLARKEDLEFIPGFDDPRIIAGQGTAGLEILQQLPEVDCVVVPYGGGGLLAGIALALKSGPSNPSGKTPRVIPKIIGVRSEWAVANDRSKQVGGPRPLLLPATIAEGIALAAGKLNRLVIDALVDEVVVVSESDIARAIVRLLELERTVVEGAGSAGVAALMAGLLPAECKKIAVMVCGSNIDMNVLSRLLERDMGERGRLLKMEVSVPDRPGSLNVTTGILAKAGANVLQVVHDRSFSRLPGNVDITFELEVRDAEHKRTILQSLADSGIEAREL